MDHEDLIENILEGLDDDYRSIIDIVEGRETTISFDELHEKLNNRELSLNCVQTLSSPLPVTTNYATSKFRPGNITRRSNFRQ